MSEELLPCPFCGSEELKSGGDDKYVGVWCCDCQAHGPNHYGRIAWNTRADLARAQVAAAYERAAGVVEKLFNDHTDDFIAEAIRTLTPDDAKAALDDMLKAERDRIAGLVMVLRAHDPETDFEKGFDAACVAVLREISALAQEGGE